jgi:predicted NAD/FAD-dependent oxidoreductase
MRIAIIGAGMAGLACAEKLTAAGATVTLFDKGRGPGGRMSTRRIATPLGDAAFDHGAQYFTARDPAFQDRVARWAEAGVVAPWPAAGADAWVGVPGMNAPVKQMAAGSDVRWSVQIEALTREGDRWRPIAPGLETEPFDTILLAVPAEQAAPLLQPWDADMASHATTTQAQPCWTAMAAFDTRLPIDADILRDKGIIGWAARNNAKPGRSTPEAWVIQANPAWSASHLEDDRDTILPALLQGFADAAGHALATPIAATAHRWRFARSGSLGAGLLWNPGLRVGACGDWLLGPRVECGWVSGDRLANAALEKAH